MSASGYYSDALPRPEDKLYTQWLEIARADAASADENLRDCERVLAERGKAQDPCDLAALVRLLRRQAADNRAIALEIIRDPDGVLSRDRMQRALETTEWRRYSWPPSN